jgi:hypothetical protein
LYANLDSQYNITIPIDLGGEYSISFGIAKDVEIKVGDRVFFNSVNSKIENGIIKVNVEDALTFECEDVNEILHPKTVQVHTRSDQLDKRLKEYEFILALCKHQMISVGVHRFDVDVEGFGDISEIERQYAYWHDVQLLLNKLNVTKPLLLSTIKSEDFHHIELLRESILRGNLLNSSSENDELYILSIGNINLLIWSSKVGDNKCRMGDFFDGSIELGFQRDDEMLAVSPFSYLRNKLWHKIDNIPFETLIESMNSVAMKHDFAFELANFDLLAMIKGADDSQNDDVRFNELLKWSLVLNAWLIERASNKTESTICKINQLQILKRQRPLNPQENEYLQSLLSDEDIDSQLKLGASALLEDEVSFLHYKNEIPPTDFANLNEQPIAKFFFE